MTQEEIMDRTTRVALTYLAAGIGAALALLLHASVLGTVAAFALVIAVALARDVMMAAVTAAAGYALTTMAVIAFETARMVSP